MEINHWHTFDFPEYQCKGKDDSPAKAKAMSFPEDFKGLSVLDVGAWDGYFSFLAERRGASRVLAVDTMTWKEDMLWDVNKNSFIPHSKKLGFDTAHKALNSKVESKEIEVEDITTETVGEFDVVLCLGILYHMKNPFKVIENLAKITKKTIIIESHTDGNYLAVPAMIYYPGRTLNNDPCNWWGPNVQCLIEMLVECGFDRDKMKFGVGGSRVVIHASK